MLVAASYFLLTQVTNVHSCPCPGDWSASHPADQLPKKEPSPPLQFLFSGVGTDAVRREKFVVLAGSRTTIYVGRSPEERSSWYSI